MKKRRNDIRALIERYQRFSVVSEIEQNLINANGFKAITSSLVLSPLFSEQNYDLSCYKNLEDSLKKDGFLVPLIVVETKEGKYEIINGVKRFLLGKKLNMKEMPVIKADINENRKYSYILENIQAEGDSPYVKTYAFSVLKNRFGYSEETISSLASISLAQVKNILRLERLPDFLKVGLRSFKLSYAEARCLLNLPIERQKELYEAILAGQVSVRDLEKEKRKFMGNKRKTTIFQKGKTVVITFESEEEAKKNLLKITREFKD